MDAREFESEPAFRGDGDTGRGFDVRIYRADSLSTMERRALSLEFQAALKAVFGDERAMNKAFDDSARSAYLLNTQWVCGLRAAQTSIAEDWPGSQHYGFQVERVYDLR